MGLGNFFADSFRQTSKKFEIVHFPMEKAGKKYDPEPFREGESYCKILLAEMALERSVDWFKKRYPVVHSAVGFKYGKDDVALPFIAEPGFLKTRDRNALGRVVQLNYALTPLFPFNHGAVELEAGLFSMVAEDWVDKFVKTLRRFSKLIPNPELSSVMKLTGPVYDGVQDLIGAGDGKMEIGCRLSFAEGRGGGNTLTPGYFAVFHAEHDQLAGFDFKIIHSRLHAAEKNAGEDAIYKPFKGFSYMLFEIKKLDHQVVETLEGINKLYLETVEALDRGNKKAARELAVELKMAIMRSPDLSRKDRRELRLKMDGYLNSSLLQGTSKGVGDLSLHSIMKLPPPPPDPEAEAEIKELEDFFDR